MGKLLSKIFGNREMRILMLGLDAAGKTSIFAVRKFQSLLVIIETSYSCYCLFSILCVK